MFRIFFEWRRASKCKRLLRCARRRLKLLTNKRNSIVLYLRSSVAELLKSGHQQKAFNRVEQLIKEQNLVKLYHLLDRSAESAIHNISYIGKTKDCPDDIMEAISTLIFASAWCGDLPELLAVRKLFQQRYGDKFVMAALELFCGNLVKVEVKELLSTGSVDDNLKYRIMNEICRDYNSCPYAPLTLHCSSQLHQQLAKDDAKEVPSALDFSSQLQHQRTKDDAKEVPLALECSSLLQKQLVKDYANEVPSEVEYSSQLLRQLAKDDDKDVPSALGYSSQLQHLPVEEQNQEKVSTVRSPQSLLELRDNDDIEEFQSSMKEDENTHDHRFFLFMSPSSNAMPKRGEKTKDTDDNGNKSSRNSGKSQRMAAKRSRKGSVSWNNNQTMKDEFERYYGEPKTHPQRKAQRKVIKPMEAKGLQTHHQCCTEMGSDLNRLGYTCKSEKDAQCSLDQPCYFCASSDKESRETKAYDNRKNVTALILFPTPGLNRKMQYNTSPSPQSPCLPPPQSVQQNNEGESGDKQIQGMEIVEVKRLSSAASWTSSNSSSSRRADTGPAYSRVMTMPLPDRPKYGDNVQRSKSFPISLPHFVHPKLPDYEELKAKFMELRNTHLRFKDY